jgi:hypothetical protein
MVALIAKCWRFRVAGRLGVPRFGLAQGLQA